MAKKYGIRDADGNVTGLDQKEYQEKYIQLRDANKISVDESNVLEGQQLRPSQNKGAGLYVEESEDQAEREAREAREKAEKATPVIENKSVPAKNMMAENFKPKKDIWK